jgi:hypothetical protein
MTFSQVLELVGAFLGGAALGAIAGYWYRGKNAVTAAAQESVEQKQADAKTADAANAAITKAADDAIAKVPTESVDDELKQLENLP